MYARPLLRAGFVALLLTPAFAQAPPQAPPPLAPSKKMHDPKACAHTRATVGEGGSREEHPNLSRQLAQSNGVICPPSNIDPQMDKPAPRGGTMPVIPPPGTPGGDRNVAPK